VLIPDFNAGRLSGVGLCLILLCLAACSLARWTEVVRAREYGFVEWGELRLGARPIPEIRSFEGDDDCDDGVVEFSLSDRKRV
jgi:hypothetical protein